MVPIELTGPGADDVAAASWFDAHAHDSVGHGHDGGEGEEGGELHVGGW